MSSGSSSTPSSTSSDSPRPRRVSGLTWIIAFLFLTALCVAAVQFQQSRPRESQLDHNGPAPEFTFTAQDGSKVSTADLKGKVWVANFIFTRCAGPCPVMTSRMAEINDAIKAKGAEVALVSMTVDPDYDSPEILKSYGEKVGATPDKWKFLTGPKDQIASVSRGFLQALSSEPSGTPIHSTRFIVVDRDGQMRSFRDGADPEAVQQLLVDIGDLLREPKKGQ